MEQKFFQPSPLSLSGQPVTLPKLPFRPFSGKMNRLFLPMDINQKRNILSDILRLAKKEYRERSEDAQSQKESGAQENLLKKLKEV